MSTTNLQIEQREALNQLDIKDALGSKVVFKEDSVNEEKNANNSFFVGAGNRTGFTLSKPKGTAVLSPGAVIQSQVVVSESTVIRGGTFVCDGNKPAIVVQPTGTLILVGATIVKEAGLQDGANDNYILVEDGGNANIVATLFHGAQTTGYVVYNESVHHNHVDVTGCANLTGQGHRHVTTVGEVP